MYVIMAYDVGVERVVKVLKTGRKYLNHIQNSLLEGELTPAQFTRLKREVKEIIDGNHDTVLFYILHSEKPLRKERLGIATDPAERFV
jgi:CRISPR-associated protein Cas2